MEVADERHPEHIRGNGPEQDYLSSVLVAAVLLAISYQCPAECPAATAAANEDISQGTGATLTWPTTFSCIRCTMPLASELSELYDVICIG